MRLFHPFPSIILPFIWAAGVSHSDPWLYRFIRTNLFLYAQGWLLRSGINKALWILHQDMSRERFEAQGAVGGVSLQKMRIRRDLLTLHKSLTGGWSRVGSGSALRE